MPTNGTEGGDCMGNEGISLNSLCVVDISIAKVTVCAIEAVDVGVCHH